MRCSRWAAIAVAMVLASAAAASADPITIIQDLRFTSAVADPGVRFDADRRVDIGQPNDTMRSAATAVAGMDAGASTATLSSSYADPMRWFGGGSANVSFTTPDKGDYNATSAFRVRFDVNSPVNYNFNESFTISSSLVPPTGQTIFVSANASTQLIRPAGLGLLFDFSIPTAFGRNSDGGNRAFTGLLSPGVYLLLVGAAADGFSSGGPVTGAANAGFAFTFDLTPADSSPSPTPEPASLLLLGTGIAGVFGYCRRSANSRA